jgi:hypothetical protein
MGLTRIRSLLATEATPMAKKAPSLQTPNRSWETEPAAPLSECVEWKSTAEVLQDQPDSWDAVLLDGHAWWLQPSPASMTTWDMMKRKLALLVEEWSGRTRRVVVSHDRYDPSFVKYKFRAVAQGRTSSATGMWKEELDHLCTLPVEEWQTYLSHTEFSPACLLLRPQLRTLWIDLVAKELASILPDGWTVWMDGRGSAENPEPPMACGDGRRSFPLDAAHSIVEGELQLMWWMTRFRFEWKRVALVSVDSDLVPIALFHYIRHARCPTPEEMNGVKEWGAVAYPESVWWKRHLSCSESAPASWICLSDWWHRWEASVDVDAEDSAESRMLSKMIAWMMPGTDFVPSFYASEVGTRSLWNLRYSREFYHLVRLEWDAAAEQWCIEWNEEEWNELLLQWFQKQLRVLPDTNFSKQCIRTTSERWSYLRHKAVGIVPSDASLRQWRTALEQNVLYWWSGYDPPYAPPGPLLQTLQQSDALKWAIRHRTEVGGEVSRRMDG